MPITIIAVGKKHDTLFQAAIKEYEKRLKKPFEIKWEILPHSTYEGDRARQEESRRILNKLSPHDAIVLLDERGQLLDSPALSTVMSDYLDRSQSVKIIIGGAYGVDELLQERANLVWALSPLVFPHQLVRLMLVEQLYRAQTIRANKSYHH